MVIPLLSSRMACQAGYVAANAACLRMCILSAGPNKTQGMIKLQRLALHTEDLLAAEDRAAALFE